MTLQRLKALTQEREREIVWQGEGFGRVKAMRIGIAAAALAVGSAAIWANGLAVAQDAPAVETPAVQTVVHAGRLLADPATGRVLTNQSLLIDAAGRIIAVEAGFASPEGAEVIDQSTRFVLPGLIDSHVHILTESSPSGRLESVTRSTSFAALRGVHYAERTLAAGFTTVVDLGGEQEAIFALRDAIAQGLVDGPRIIAAGRSISPHGGHGDAQGFRPEVMAVMRSPSACSGADDCRRAVRDAVQAGADVIKIAATGGVLSDTAAGLGQQLSDAELEAIVDAAHSMGRRVVAHAHGVEGINAALRAGVDGIEHGTYLDDESIRLFRRNGAYLVPTVLAGVTVYERAQIPGALTPAQRLKALEVGPLMVDMLRRAHAGGVQVAFGTDSGVSAHGDNAREFELMVEAGFTPMQAIQAATVNAAAHLGMEDRLGRLAPGYAADMIAVDGDPREDIAQLRAVRWVMARGEAVDRD
jgi:imidazolonepropionase-like amidohydrolase